MIRSFTEPDFRAWIASPEDAIPRAHVGDDADTTLLEAERRLTAFIDWWNDTPASDDEGDKRGDVRSKLRGFIATKPPRTIAGVAAKLRELWRVTGCDDNLDTDVWTADLIASTLDGIAVMEREAGR